MARKMSMTYEGNKGDREIIACIIVALFFYALLILDALGGKLISILTPISLILFFLTLLYMFTPSTNWWISFFSKKWREYGQKKTC
ncbi:MAG: hypothetical protein Q8Q90_00165 [bacterium]|nr:hypothetical protein [bacterium]